MSNWTHKTNNDNVIASDINDLQDLKLDADMVTAVPTPSKVPQGDANGKLAAGWGGNPNTVATLDGSGKVVQDPANATATPTASKIVKADANALIDGWLTALVWGSRAQRIFQSELSPGSAGFLLISGTAYFVYLGYVIKPFTPKYVEFHVSTAGVGAQTAEAGFFSTPAAPNKAGQSFSKIVSTGTLDSLTSTGVKRNTSAFATQVPAGTHLWAGIRTAMGTTQPTIWALGADMAQGQVLSLASAGVLTGAGPWSGVIIVAATAAACPDLRGTLD
jgi:hypothetical protein